MIIIKTGLPAAADNTHLIYSNNNFLILVIFFYVATTSIINLSAFPLTIYLWENTLFRFKLQLSFLIKSSKKLIIDADVLFSSQKLPFLINLPGKEGGGERREGRRAGWRVKGNTRVTMTSGSENSFEIH